MMPAWITRLLWRALAVVFMALGLLGAVLPILPTVPFLLAAAWAGGRGWPELEQWLLGHPRYGGAIQRWRSAGIVSRGAKWAASLGMAVSASGLLFTSVPAAVKAGVPLVMAIVAIWLWRRPESEQDPPPP